MAVVSPCVGICVLDSATAFCRGCKRTLEEIAGWTSMNDEQRLAVIAKLPTRTVVPIHSSGVRTGTTS